MRPLKNFVQNKISAFQPKKFYISFLEVPNTNSKEILREKKQNKTKLSLILDENANRQEFCPK